MISPTKLGSSRDFQREYMYNIFIYIYNYVYIYIFLYLDNDRIIEYIMGIYIWSFPKMKVP